jgi:hypothetical protein
VLVVTLVYAYNADTVTEQAVSITLGVTQGIGVLISNSLFAGCMYKCQSVCDDGYFTDDEEAEVAARNAQPTWEKIPL